MRVYGSLNNRIMEHSLSPTPELGMGATIYMWSDRLAGTVTKISKTGKTIEITEDVVVDREPWPSGYAKSYAPNPNGRIFTARRRPNGTWKSGGNGVTLGSRAAYRDPHF